MDQKSFLGRVIDQLPSDNSFFSGATIIMPTKRACLYLRDQLLAGKSREALWLPEIISLKDFLYTHAPLTIAPQEDLLAMLYKTYLEVSGRSQAFSEFYKWGEMILKDFNDIDQYLIDPDYLFQYVQSFKRIEQEGILTEEQTAWLAQFWHTVPAGSTSAAKRDFLETWEHLGALYAAFGHRLRAGEQAYEGMAYKALLHRLEAGETRFDRSSFVVVGFNALSAFEERFFQHLLSRYDTRIFWDADSSYLADEQQEAGMFIRRYAKLFAGPNNFVIEHEFAEADRTVEIVETDMPVGQCDFAISRAMEWQGGDTAIVLCDESLIVPMIFRLPSELPANITMGYPLQMSGLHSLVQKLCDLKFILETEHRLSAMLLVKIMRYPWMEAQAPAGAVGKLEQIVQQRGFVNTAELEQLFPGEESLMHALTSDLPTAQYLRGVLGRLSLHGQAAETEVLRSYLKVLEEFELWLQRYSLNPDPVEVFRLLRFRLSSGRIPFLPEEGDHPLQIMGFLETRNLDFRRLIIIGASDDHLPGTNKAGSFIPYSLRRGLGLPTHHENDAIYGYHFFRLLQRAEQICLVYPAQSENRKQSRSRFIEQILYEWKDRKSIQLSERHVGQPVPAVPKAEPIAVEKQHPQIQAVLGEYLDGSRSLSASAINTYVRCPFQFYLSKVVGLPEPEELSDDLDQRALGTVFHAAMELLYKPYEGTGEAITRELLEGLARKAHLEPIIQEAFTASEIDFPRDGFKGRNFLVHRIIREFMVYFIRMDMDRTPFAIEGLEWRFDGFEIPLSGNRRVLLKGVIDRVDRVGEQAYRIIDYKTGKVNIPKRFKMEEAEAYLESVFQESDLKEALQSYVYAWVYRSMHAGSHVSAGLYSARSLDGLVELHGGQPIPPAHFSIIEAQLCGLLEEMFDLSIPFIQKEGDAYQYSPYGVLVD